MKMDEKLFQMGIIIRSNRPFDASRPCASAGLAVNILAHAAGTRLRRRNMRETL